MISKSFRQLAIALVCASLVGCAQNVSSTTYNSSEVGVAAKVVPGVVLSRRAVKIDANSGAGGIAGAAAGAAAGSGVGGSVQGNIVGAIGGAVAGGLMGNAIDKGVNNQQGIEYIIKLKSGETISVVQAANVQFAPKQHILVIYGAMTRLVADSTQ